MNVRLWASQMFPSKEEFLQILILHLFMGMLFSFAFVIGPLIFFCIPFFSGWRIFMMVYLVWAFYDEVMGVTDIGEWHWLKNHVLWKYVRDYFPARLIKTSELECGKNHIFAVFPHSFIPMSSFVNFLTNANGMVTELFPGIKLHPVSFHFFFYVPLFREIIRMWGLRRSTESALVNILKSGSSNALLVYPGSASEMGFSTPGDEYVIVARRRKGFIRIALRTGASLVPVFTFGDINLFHRLEFTKIPNLLSMLPKMEKILGPNLSLWYGRGFWAKWPGYIPLKMPTNTIVGAPISVPKVKHPTDDMINEYHEKFLRALQELFEKHRYEYDTIGGNSKLIMI